MATIDPSSQFQSIADNTNKSMQDQLSSYNQGYSTGLSNLQNKQQGETADYLGRYTNAVNALPNEQQLWTQLGAQQNLPQLQQLASTANIAVSNIPRDSLDYARQNGGGGGLDNNQLQQLVQQKLYDLAPVAQRATQQYQDAANLVQQQMQWAVDQQNRSLLPLQQEGSLLSDRLAREQTGYTAQQQAALDGLTAKLQTQGSLSSAEMSQLTQLAYQENEFQNQLALQQQGAGLNYGNAIGEANYTHSLNYPTTAIGGSSSLNYPSSAAPSSTPGSGSSSNFGIDYSKGLNLNAALKSGGLG